MVWQRYRTTAPITQAFIFIACAVLYWGMKSPLSTVIAAFVVMQLGAIVGAFMAVRMVRKMQEADAKAGGEPKLPK